jgi:hypothetical protein
LFMFSSIIIDSPLTMLRLFSYLTEAALFKLSVTAA